MEILTTSGTMYITQSVLSKIPTAVLTAALQNVIKLSLYCIPSPAWFPGEKFPRLSSRSTMPIPSLRLMQRMAQLVWKRGSDEEAELLLDAALEQTKYSGAPWSWFALDAPILLTRCRGEYIFSLLSFFTTRYGGPEQYTAAILPMLMNAVNATKDTNTAAMAGSNRRHFHAALLWVLDHPDETLPALRIEYRVACVAALPLPDRKTHAAALWKAARHWTPTARGGVLFLANCAGVLPHIFPHMRAISDFEHEAVWNWTVRHLQQHHMLKEYFPRILYDVIRHWKTLPAGSGSDNGSGNSNSNSNATDEPDVCCICMEKISSAPAVQTARCSHAFHAACLYTWAVKKNDCPICRTELGRAAPVYSSSSLSSLLSSSSSSSSSLSLAETAETTVVREVIDILSTGASASLTAAFQRYFLPFFSDDNNTTAAFDDSDSDDDIYRSYLLAVHFVY